ncbi:NAD(P)-binding domain-containing protein [Streptomyces sp. RY43-2]|uniref:NAD(P)-binding domain-containing protein n=1 Tax=Streptomyces macrolidinus TaxID=2952607 RepID=A0ABT0ZM65_9ACTN|nr:NAD(P)-binding domain-containing protein [Streptomyces macrolidinus]MCN9244628.1 NAD(P)-binding domain-containing protein [Streptomyces macrolidinus]
MNHPVRSAGVLGAGRLGSALAARLTGRLPLTVSDRDPAVAQALARRLDVPAVAPAELAARCEVVLVCVPPPVVADAIASCRAHTTTGAPTTVFVNLATSVPTAQLRDDPRLRDLTVVALKPVCQYTAVAHGVPTVFVTPDAGQLPLLRALVDDLGTVLLIDEKTECTIGTINRIATKAALHACSALREELAELGAEPALITAAVTNVFAGTAVDFPPDPANPYTAALLRELAASDNGPATDNGPASGNGPATDHGPDTRINSTASSARSVGGAVHPAARP